MYKGLQGVVKRLTRHKVTLKKITLTEADSHYGTITRTTAVSAIISVSVSPVRLEDEAFLPAGIAKQGDLRIFFHPSYNLTTVVVTPAALDIVNYQGVDFELLNISDLSDGTSVFLKEGYARRIGT